MLAYLKGYDAISHSAICLVDPSSSEDVVPNSCFTSWCWTVFLDLQVKVQHLD